MKRRLRLLGVVVIVLGMGLTGCANKPGDYAPSMEMVSNEMVTEAPTEDGTAMDKTLDEGTGETKNASGEVQISLASNLNRKIIKTGNLDIESKQFDQTINGIFTKVQKVGGFIESCDIAGSSLYDEKSYRNGQLTVRIPEKQFDSFINGASSFGNITRQAIQAEDITDTYVDTETRVRTLEVRRERLLTLLEKSGSLTDLFEIEKEVGNVNYEIETLKGTLGKYDALVDYATVTIAVREVELYQATEKPETFGDKIGQTFNESINSLVSLGKLFILFIVALGPYLFVVGIPIVIIVRVVVKQRKKVINKEENVKK